MNSFIDSFKDVVRELVFGMEDGLVSNLGLVLGIYIGGGGTTAIVLAGISSMFAGAFSMSAGSYLSAKSQREVYEHEIDVAEKSLKENPKKYLSEMKKILKEEGFDADEIKVLLHHFEHHNHSTFVTNYVQKKVGLTKERLDHPLRNALTMFSSFLFGSIFPILPFIFLTSVTAVKIATTVTALALFCVGLAKTYYTKRNWFKSGLEVLIVGISAGLIGYLIGFLFRVIY